MAYDYEYFKQAVFRLTGIDLNAYKEKQMKRRIDTLIAKNNIVGYEKFVEQLRSNSALFEEFINYLTINVSEFYRNPDQWKLLVSQVIPNLIHRTGGKLTIWSAACSTGDEPYSLVMALSQFIPLDMIHIIATDIDKQVIEKAKIGLYNEKSIAGVPEEYKKKYFTKVGASFKISDEIKNRVEFRVHNLLKDKYLSNVDLIVCRNVLIYFTEEAKEEVFGKFANSLRPGGVLFIGSTEQIISYREIGLVRMNTFFYTKNLS